MAFPFTEKVTIIVFLGATLEDRGLIGQRDSMRTVVPVGLDDGYAFPAYIER